MTALLAFALAVPLVGAVATVLADRIADGGTARRVGIGSAVVAAAAWAVVVSADTPPELGRIEAGALPVAAVAGLALLVAAHLPRTPLAASSFLCGVTVFAAASTADAGDGSDRPLAVGVALLFLLASARLRAEAAPALALVSLAVAGAALTVGLLIDDERVGAVVAIAGATSAIVVAAVSGAALLLAPVVLYATARAAGAGHAARGADDIDLVGVGGVAAPMVAMVVIHLLVRVAPGWVRRAPTGRILPVSAALLATVLLSQDLDGLRSAGVLLAAGAVLAAATTHPVGSVACLPGLAAGVEAFGDAGEPVHAAAGAAAALVLAGALLAPSIPGRRISTGDWPLLPAAAFAVVPLWGWTGVDDASDYSAAVAASGAGAMVVVLGVVLAGFLPPGRGRSLGKLRSRHPAATHGSTNPQAEQVDPVRQGRRVASEAEGRAPEARAR